jgi:hypothetical protein
MGHYCIIGGYSHCGYKGYILVMQTFLPYPDFKASAKVLDYRRLGKQRVEAFQILRALYIGGGWKNHPAVKMWRGYHEALIFYQNTMIEEWVERGYNNTMEITFCECIRYPPWVGDEAFHASHRSNLLRKDPQWYGQYEWKESPDMPYVWPV